ncbi:hypothetical protein PVT68_15380 [Microbulbifer bruguierae]|uniref:Uncharacterized protein n=1 Tax=Microbulbifer bruguierae TaxID=3029061 RepID=A0ABY8NEG2_9GAMM|nr:hypothetical protein [Microbulbifer bruguierae]WGL16142.1 hypothetical protein PVT68_15380 [Microbulbifer bruguierae]
MTDHQWLMTSQALNTLRKLRKRIQAEFGISLRFSDFDFESQLARLKHRSKDNQTRNLISELEVLRGSPFLTGEEPPERLYRGQKIYQEQGGRDIYEMIYGEELGLHNGRGLPKSQQKMYRGQPILN